MSEILETTDRQQNANRTTELRSPSTADGADMWRLARDSGTLDLNSSYAYLLWARDFADTSVIATAGDEVAGFTTGYRRPDAQDTLMIWQVAVAPGHRGRGLARRMLDHLADDEELDRLETTITADNHASIALFNSFATARGASIERHPLFPAAEFPDGHQAEVLFRVGPLAG